MSQELLVLLGSAAAIGGGHTLLGPDHYVPFVVLSKVRMWSVRKTLLITAACGLGHVVGSVGLGLVGIATGITLRRLELLESGRGDIAAWMLVAFGLAYGSWGIVRARRGEMHTHAHGHADGSAHSHDHSHEAEHVHPHGADARAMTPWILFTIFVFGPCEPLIPLLMFPAAALSPGAVVLVATVFGAVTIATMTAIVYVSLLGVELVPMERLGRYSHALAGLTIFLCGVAIHLGL